MNRRGHIGTMLLVIGALILVVSALYVMTRFGDDVSKVRSEMRSLSGKSSVGHKDVLVSVEKMVLMAVDSSTSVEFEKIFNESIKKFAEEKRASGVNANVYAKIALGEYSLNFDGTNYVLIVNNVFENTGVGNNEVHYIYNLRVLFDKSSVISVDVL